MSRLVWNPVEQNLKLDLPAGDGGTARRRDGDGRNVETSGTPSATFGTIIETSRTFDADGKVIHTSIDENSEGTATGVWSARDMSADTALDTSARNYSARDISASMTGTSNESPSLPAGDATSPRRDGSSPRRDETPPPTVKKFGENDVVPRLTGFPTSSGVPPLTGFPSGGLPLSSGITAGGFAMVQDNIATHYSTFGSDDARSSAAMMTGGGSRDGADGRMSGYNVDPYVDINSHEVDVNKDEISAEMAKDRQSTTAKKKEKNGQKHSSSVRGRSSKNRSSRNGRSPRGSGEKESASIKQRNSIGTRSGRNGTPKIVGKHGANETKKKGGGKADHTSSPKTGKAPPSSKSAASGFMASESFELRTKRPRTLRLSEGNLEEQGKLDGDGANNVNSTTKDSLTSSTKLTSSAKPKADGAGSMTSGKAKAKATTSEKTGVQTDKKTRSPKDALISRKDSAKDHGAKDPVKNDVIQSLLGTGLMETNQSLMGTTQSADSEPKVRQTVPIDTILSKDVGIEDSPPYEQFFCESEIDASKKGSNSGTKSVDEQVSLPVENTAANTAPNPAQGEKQDNYVEPNIVVTGISLDSTGQSTLGQSEIDASFGDSIDNPFTDRYATDTTIDSKPKKSNLLSINTTNANSGFRKSVKLDESTLDMNNRQILDHHDEQKFLEGRILSARTELQNEVGDVIKLRKSRFVDGKVSRKIEDEDANPIAVFQQAHQAFKEMTRTANGHVIRKIVLTQDCYQNSNQDGRRMIEEEKLTGMIGFHRPSELLKQSNVKYKCVVLPKKPAGEVILLESFLADRLIKVLHFLAEKLTKLQTLKMVKLEDATSSTKLDYFLIDEDLRFLEAVVLGIQDMNDLWFHPFSKTRIEIVEQHRQKQEDLYAMPSGNTYPSDKIGKNLKSGELATKSSYVMHSIAEGTEKMGTLEENASMGTMKDPSLGSLDDHPLEEKELIPRAHIPYFLESILSLCNYVSDNYEKVGAFLALHEEMSREYMNDLRGRLIYCTKDAIKETLTPPQGFNKAVITGVKSISSAPTNEKAAGSGSPKAGSPGTAGSKDDHKKTELKDTNSSTGNEVEEEVTAPPLFRFFITKDWDRFLQLRLTKDRVKELYSNPKLKGCTLGNIFEKTASPSNSEDKPWQRRFRKVLEENHQKVEDENAYQREQDEQCKLSGINMGKSGTVSGKFGKSSDPVLKSMRDTKAGTVSATLIAKRDRNQSAIDAIARVTGSSLRGFPKGSSWETNSTTPAIPSQQAFRNVDSQELRKFEPKVGQVTGRELNPQSQMSRDMESMEDAKQPTWVFPQIYIPLKDRLGQSLAEDQSDPALSSEGNTDNILINAKRAKELLQEEALDDVFSLFNYVISTKSIAHCVLLGPDDKEELRVVMQDQIELDKHKADEEREKQRDQDNCNSSTNKFDPRASNYQDLRENQTPDAITMSEFKVGEAGGEAMDKRATEHSDDKFVDSGNVGSDSKPFLSALQQILNEMDPVGDESVDGNLDEKSSPASCRPASGMAASEAVFATVTSVGSAKPGSQAFKSTMAEAFHETAPTQEIELIDHPVWRVVIVLKKSLTIPDDFEIEFPRFESDTARIHYGFRKLVDPSTQVVNPETAFLFHKNDLISGANRGGGSKDTMAGKGGEGGATSELQFQALQETTEALQDMQEENFVLHTKYESLFQKYENTLNNYESDMRFIQRNKKLAIDSMHKHLVQANRNQLDANTGWVQAVTAMNIATARLAVYEGQDLAESNTRIVLPDQLQALARSFGIPNEPILEVFRSEVTSIQKKAADYCEVMREIMTEFAEIKTLILSKKLDVKIAVEHSKNYRQKAAALQKISNLGAEMLDVLGGEEEAITSWGLDKPALGSTSMALESIQEGNFAEATMGSAGFKPGLASATLQDDRIGVVSSRSSAARRASAAIAVAPTTSAPSLRGSLLGGKQGHRRTKSAEAGHPESPKGWLANRTSSQFDDLFADPYEQVVSNSRSENLQAGVPIGSLPSGISSRSSVSFMDVVRAASKSMKLATADTPNISLAAQTERSPELTSRMDTGPLLDAIIDINRRTIVTRKDENIEISLNEKTVGGGTTLEITTMDETTALADVADNGSTRSLYVALGGGSDRDGGGDRVGVAHKDGGDTSNGGYDTGTVGNHDDASNTSKKSNASRESESEDENAQRNQANTFQVSILGAIATQARKSIRSISMGKFFKTEEWKDSPKTLTREASTEPGKVAKDASTTSVASGLDPEVLLVDRKESSTPRYEDGSTPRGSIPPVQGIPSIQGISGASFGSTLSQGGFTPRSTSVTPRKSDIYAKAIELQKQLQTLDHIQTQESEALKSITAARPQGINAIVGATGAQWTIVGGSMSVGMRGSIGTGPRARASVNEQVTFDESEIEKINGSGESGSPSARKSAAASSKTLVGIGSKSMGVGGSTDVGVAGFMPAKNITGSVKAKNINRAGRNSMNTNSNTGSVNPGSGISDSDMKNLNALNENVKAILHKTLPSLQGTLKEEERNDLVRFLNLGGNMLQGIQPSLLPAGTISGSPENQDMLGNQVNGPMILTGFNAGMANLLDQYENLSMFGGGNSTMYDGKPAMQMQLRADDMVGKDTVVGKMQSAEKVKMSSGLTMDTPRAIESFVKYANKKHNRSLYQTLYIFDSVFRVNELKTDHNSPLIRLQGGFRPGCLTKEEQVKSYLHKAPHLKEIYTHYTSMGDEPLIESGSAETAVSKMGSKANSYAPAGIQLSAVVGMSQGTRKLMSAVVDSINHEDMMQSINVFLPWEIPEHMRNFKTEKNKPDTDGTTQRKNSPDLGPSTKSTKRTRSTKSTKSGNVAEVSPEEEPYRLVVDIPDNIIHYRKPLDSVAAKFMEGEIDDTDGRATPDDKDGKDAGKDGTKDSSSGRPEEKLHISNNAGEAGEAECDPLLRVSNMSRYMKNTMDDFEDFLDGYEVAFGTFSTKTDSRWQKRLDARKGMIKEVNVGDLKLLLQLSHPIFANIRAWRVQLVDYANPSLVFSNDENLNVTDIQSGKFKLGVIWLTRIQKYICANSMAACEREMSEKGKFYRLDFQAMPVSGLEFAKMVRSLLEESAATIVQKDWDPTHENRRFILELILDYKDLDKECLGILFSDDLVDPFRNSLEVLSFRGNSKLGPSKSSWRWMRRHWPPNLKSLNLEAISLPGCEESPTSSIFDNLSPRNYDSNSIGRQRNHGVLRYILPYLPPTLEELSLANNGELNERDMHDFALCTGGLLFGNDKADIEEELERAREILYGKKDDYDIFGDSITKDDIKERSETPPEQLLRGDLRKDSLKEFPDDIDVKHPEGEKSTLGLGRPSRNTKPNPSRDSMMSRNMMSINSNESGIDQSNLGSLNSRKSVSSRKSRKSTGKARPTFRSSKMINDRTLTTGAGPFRYSARPRTTAWIGWNARMTTVQEELAGGTNGMLAGLVSQADRAEKAKTKAMSMVNFGGTPTVEDGSSPKNSPRGSRKDKKMLISRRDTEDVEEGIAGISWGDTEDAEKDLDSPTRSDSPTNSPTGNKPLSPMQRSPTAQVLSTLGKKNSVGNYPESGRVSGVVPQQRITFATAMPKAKFRGQNVVNFTAGSPKSAAGFPARVSKTAGKGVFFSDRASTVVGHAVRASKVGAVEIPGRNTNVSGSTTPASVPASSRRSVSSTGRASLSPGSGGRMGKNRQSIRRSMKATVRAIIGARSLFGSKGQADVDSKKVGSIGTGISGDETATISVLTATKPISRLSKFKNQVRSIYTSTVLKSSSAKREDVAAAAERRFEQLQAELLEEGPTPGGFPTGSQECPMEFRPYSYLVSLNLSNCPKIQDQGVKTLITMQPMLFGKVGTVRELFLAHVGMTVIGLKCVLANLNAQNMLTIDVSWNPIRDEGIVLALAILSEKEMQKKTVTDTDRRCSSRESSSSGSGSQNDAKQDDSKDAKLEEAAPFKYAKLETLNLAGLIVNERETLEVVKNLNEFPLNFKTLDLKGWAYVDVNNSADIVHDKRIVIHDHEDPIENVRIAVEKETSDKQEASASKNEEDPVENQITPIHVTSEDHSTSALEESRPLSDLALGSAQARSTQHAPVQGTGQSNSTPRYSLGDSSPRHAHEPYETVGKMQSGKGIFGTTSSGKSDVSGIIPGTMDLTHSTRMAREEMEDGIGTGLYGDIDLNTGLHSEILH